MPIVEIQDLKLVDIPMAKGPAKVMPVASLEPITGYWSGKSDWGQSYKGVFPQASGVLISMGRVVYMPGPPRARTIMLGRKDLQGPNTTDNYGIRAKITYGCGGATNVVYVDWTNGQTVTVVASSIQVDCETYAPVVGGAAYDVPATQPALDISSAIGIESAGQSNPTYTVLVDTESSPNARSIAVPQMAKEVSVQQVIASGTPALNFGIPGPQPGGVFPITSTQLAALIGRYIPIPGHCNYIECSARAYWALTFKLAV